MLVTDGGAEGGYGFYRVLSARLRNRPVFGCDHRARVRRLPPAGCPRDRLRGYAVAAGCGSGRASALS